MKHLQFSLISFCCIIAIALYSYPSMALTQQSSLSQCAVDTNCIFVEWSFSNVKEPHKKVIEIARNLPRTQTIDQTDKYWHGVVRSLIFRFPDDLEILQVPTKDIIQIRSSSRVGISDLGVNKKRIDNLYSELENNFYKD